MEKDVGRLNSPPRAEVHEAAFGCNVEDAPGDQADGLSPGQRRQSRQQLSSRVLKLELRMHAIRGHCAIMSDCVYVGGVPIHFHAAGGDMAAFQVFQAPVTRIRIDERRPESENVRDAAGADLNVELQPDAVAVGPQFGMHLPLKMRPVQGEAIEREALFDRTEVRRNIHRVDLDGQLAGPLSGDHDVV